VGSGPKGVAVNPTTNRIYVTNYYSHNVSVINGGTNTVVATVPVGSGPYGVAVNPTTNRVYVANNWGNVSVIDGGTNTVVATVPVGSGPEGVAVNPATNRIYVANNWSDSVSVVDGGTNTVVATVPVGSGPEGVAVNPTTNRIYVANYLDATVSVIEDRGGPEPTATSVPTPSDTPTPAPCVDGDGIADEVDTDLCAFSNDFTDEPLGGTTFGSIVDRGGLLVEVAEEPNPDGVRIRATGTGGPARITACRDPQTSIKLDPGNQVVVTCGSATVRVLSGPVMANFGSVIAELAAGTAVTAVETSAGTFDFGCSSTSGGSVIVGGLVLVPGETATGMTDTDGDGLVDAVESNTGVFVDTRNTGTDPNDADTDHDLLSDGAEVLIYHSNPLIVDTDGDGCGDGEELGPIKALGGQRDPLNPYDFYDITNVTFVVGAKDKVVWVADLSMLSSWGNIRAGGPPNLDGKSYDADTNGNTIPDGREMDFAGVKGPHSGPDGGIGPADMSAFSVQEGDSCVAPP
jgi:YVTN family beta-propeller protein